MPSVLNLGRIKPVWKGAWNAATAYVLDDMVSYMGHSYICVQANTGSAPALGTDNSFWNVLAKGQTVLTSKGDLLWHDGNSVNRLPAGSVGNVLKVAQDGSLNWGLLDGKPSATAAKLMEHHGAVGGYYNSGYISPDGTAKIWGQAGVGQNGDGAQNPVYVPRPITFLLKPTNPRVKQLVMGGRSVFAVMEDGKVYSWGANYSGNLGHGDTTNRTFPTRIEYFVTNNIQIAKVFVSGSRYNLGGTSENAMTFFLDTLGRLYACGNNAVGQLGVGDTSNRSLPVRVGTYEGITDVCIAYENTYGSSYFLMGGEIYASGYNNLGQLGLGDTVNRSAFTKVSGLTNVTKVAASASYNGTGATAFGAFALALRSDKTVWATGYNGQGQLGIGDTTNRSSFVQVSGLNTVIDIGCAQGFYGYSWAVTQDKKLATWGYNGQGCLGLGDKVNKTSPVIVDQWFGDFITAGSGTSLPPFNGKIKKVIAGGTYGSQNLTVLTDDGLLFSSGLARGTTTPEGIDVQYVRFKPWLQFGLPDGTIFVDIQETSVDNAIAYYLLASDGRVFATGDNSQGALGYQEGSVSNQQMALQAVQA